MTVPTNPQFPTAIDGDEYFGGDVPNSVRLSLAADISSATTIFNVIDNIDEINVPLFLIFDTGEIVYIESKDDNAKEFGSVSRGVGGTSPQPHTAGETITLTMTGNHYNLLKAMCIKIITELGVNPAGIFADVSERFGLHDHDGASGGTQVDTANLFGHTKAAHDALNINADTVDGLEGSDLAAVDHVHDLGELNGVDATAEGHGGGFDADTVDGYEGAALADNLRAASGGTLQIAADELALSGSSFYYIFPEGVAQYDDLEFISGGQAGDIVILALYNLDDEITIRHGANNIECPLGENYTMSASNPQIPLRYDGTVWRLAQWANNVGTVVFSVGSHIDPIDAGDTYYLPVDLDCKIVGWTLVTDQPGSIEIGVWQRDRVLGKPTGADAINGAFPPKTVSADLASSVDLTGWSPDLVSGYILGFHINSNDVVTFATLTLKVLKK